MYCDACKHMILLGEGGTTRFFNPYRSMIPRGRVLFSIQLCERCMDDVVTLRKTLEVQAFMECLYHVCPTTFTPECKQSIIENVFPPPPPPPPPSPLPDPVTIQFSDLSQPITVDGFEMELTAQDLMDHLREMQGVSLHFLDE